MKWYEDNGYRLATIRQLLASTDYSGTRELPPVPEGSWNPEASGGVFCWMGRNDGPWENDAGILSCISRARRQLIHAECRASVDPSLLSESSRSQLEQAWELVIRAEISDGLGWLAGPHAVQYVLRAAEDAYILANQAMDEGAECDLPVEVTGTNLQDSSTPKDRLPEPEMFGSKGDVSCSFAGSAIRIYDVQFEAVEATCGVRFPFELEEIMFCPSGLEDVPTRIPLDVLKPKLIALPLANGLIQVSNDVFLIKETSYVHVAALVHIRDPRMIEFACQGAPVGKRYHWRFHLLSSTVTTAVKYANRINSSERADCGP